MGCNCATALDDAISEVRKLILKPKKRRAVSLDDDSIEEEFKEERKSKDAEKAKEDPLLAYAAEMTNYTWECPN
jgi:hypothetical protein